MKHYTQQTEITKQYIKQKINEFILEDMPKGDITTEKTIKNSARSKANIQACEKFVFVGEKIILIKHLIAIINHIAFLK